MTMQWPTLAMRAQHRVAAARAEAWDEIQSKRAEQTPDVSV